jgi:hypothetical protein
MDKKRTLVIQYFDISGIQKPNSATRVLKKLDGRAARGGQSADGRKNVWNSSSCIWHRNAPTKRRANSDEVNRQ